MIASVVASEMGFSRVVVGCWKGISWPCRSLVGVESLAVPITEGID
jgi:hypothetical protein